MRSPRDDLILELAIKVRKVVAVSGDADNEMPVFLWIVLCLTQRIGVYDIELDVVSVESEVTANEMRNLP